ncbi:MAG: ribonuclease Z [Enterocloster sp.]
MILIVCIDDNKGMMFNHRRQSQDGVLRRHILDMVGNGKLWMNEYSGKMFAKDSEELLHGPVQADEDFLKKASSGEYCFVETNSCGLDMFPDTTNIESVVLYKWNRVYPADQYFTMDLSDWKLVGTVEFAGSSHEKITEERYER